MSELPLKRGDIVTIPKGTKIQTTMPNAREKIAGRTYKVKIHDVYPGFTDTSYRGKTRSVPPRVVWPGEGGYWHEANLSDIPEANASGWSLTGMVDDLKKTTGTP